MNILFRLLFRAVTSQITLGKFICSCPTMILFSKSNVIMQDLTPLCHYFIVISLMKLRMAAIFSLALPETVAWAICALAAASPGVS